MISYSVNNKNAGIGINNCTVHQIQALFDMACFPKKSNEFSIFFGKIFTIFLY